MATRQFSALGRALLSRLEDDSCCNENGAEEAVRTTVVTRRGTPAVLELCERVFNVG